MIKNTFIWWNFWNSFWDWFRKLLQNWWWVIGFFVNVQSVIIFYMVNKFILLNQNGYQDSLLFLGWFLQWLIDFFKYLHKFFFFLSTSGLNMFLNVPRSSSLWSPIFSFPMTTFGGLANICQRTCTPLFHRSILLVHRNLPRHLFWPMVYLDFPWLHIDGSFIIW